MYYQIKIKRTVTDTKGSDKSLSEDYICDVELFGQAELKGLIEFNNECDVTAIKRLPNLREFINEVGDDTDIYMATLVSIFVDEEGNETESKYNVAVYAKEINEATRLLNEYLKQGMEDLILVSVKRTKIVALLK